MEDFKKKLKDPLNIIYNGIGSCDSEGNAKYMVVLPTGLNYVFGEVYDFTVSYNTLLIFMSVNDGQPDNDDLSDYNARNHDPKNVELVACEFDFDDIKKIPGETYPGYDPNKTEFRVIICHDDENDIEAAAEDFFRNQIHKTKIDVPKTYGLGTLKKFKV